MSNQPIISVQLYSLRSLPTLDAQLDAVAEAGYQYVELVHAQLEDAANTIKKLKARGLKASSAHVPMSMLRNSYELALDSAKILELPHLFMPAFAPIERGGGVPHWADRGRELGIFARKFRSQGIRLGYHNHAWEFVPLAGGSLPMDQLINNSGDSLFWELDLAWVIRGNADPSAWLKRLQGKLLAVHVKDIAPAGQNTDEGGWAAVGSGTVDWKRYWVECLAAGATQMVVEHDNPKNPVASVKASLGYIKDELAGK
jgi:sugar phosphate isomerase/epimerase